MKDPATQQQLIPEPAIHKPRRSASQVDPSSVHDIHGDPATKWKGNKIYPEAIHCFQNSIQARDGRQSAVIASSGRR